MDIDFIKISNNIVQSNGQDGAPKRGEGLACFIRSGIRFSDSKFEELNISCSDLEMQWVGITLDKVRPIVIVNICRPPQGNHKSACKIISEAFDKANMKDNTDIFVLGDFNIDFKDTGSPAFRELYFTMQSLGLSQQIQDPTRFSRANDNARNTSTMIDLIFTNSSGPNRINIKNKDSSSYIDENKTAQFMNEYFSNIGPKLATKHSAPWAYFSNVKPTSIGDFQSDADEMVIGKMLKIIDQYHCCRSLVNF